MNPEGEKTGTYLLSSCILDSYLSSDCIISILLHFYKKSSTSTLLSSPIQSYSYINKYCSGAPTIFIFQHCGVIVLIICYFWWIFSYVVFNLPFIQKKISVFGFGKQVNIKFYFYLCAAFIDASVIISSIIRPSGMKHLRL